MCTVGWIIIGILILVAYVLLGMLAMMLYELAFDNDLPDPCDLFEGYLNQEEQNQVIIYVTFWPIFMVAVIIKFLYTAIRAFIRAIIWYLGHLYDAIKDFINNFLTSK